VELPQQTRPHLPGKHVRASSLRLTEVQAEVCRFNARELGLHSHGVECFIARYAPPGRRAAPTVQAGPLTASSGRSIDRRAGSPVGTRKAIAPQEGRPSSCLP
jgi:hypothetical protein